MGLQSPMRDCQSRSIQPFWGHVVANCGAGPVPIPHRSLSSQNLANAINFCLTPEAQKAAQTVADQMHHESGVALAVQLFHRHLNTPNITCDVLPRQCADWIVHLPKSKSYTKLSHTVLTDLISRGEVKP